MRYQNPLRQLSRAEWALWIASLVCVTAAFLIPAEKDWLNLLASWIGVTALVFISRGDVAGQVLTILFALFYGAVSWQFHYWGEMITYLGMSAPMALAATIAWIRHPFEGNANEVEAVTLPRRAFLGLFAATAAVTALFGWILAVFDTPNLIWSTVSVSTSFLAASLTYLRSPYYAVAYAANDGVLIVLWILASMKDSAHVPMVVCFCAFLIQDIRGFFYWQRMKMRQMKEKR